MFLERIVPKLIDRIPQGKMRKYVSLGFSAFLILILSISSYFLFFYKFEPGFWVETKVVEDVLIPGDTVTYFVRVITKKDNKSLSDLNFSIPFGVFLPQSLEIKRGDPTQMDAYFLEKNTKFQISDLRFPGISKFMDHKVFSFSISCVIPYDLSLVGKDHSCTLSYGKGRRAQNIKNAIPKDGSVLVAFSPYSITSSMVKGKPGPGKKLTYQIIIQNPPVPFGGTYDTSTQSIFLQELVESNFAEILSGSVKVESSRSFDQPLVARNMLLLDNLALLPGDRITLTYEVKIDKNAPFGEYLSKVTTAFVPNTDISLSTKTEYLPSMKELLSMNP